VELCLILTVSRRKKHLVPCYCARMSATCDHENVYLPTNSRLQYVGLISFHVIYYLRNFPCDRRSWLIDDFKKKHPVLRFQSFNIYSGYCVSLSLLPSCLVKHLQVNLSRLPGCWVPSQWQLSTKLTPTATAAQRDDIKEQTAWKYCHT
jgi:hypothetical protein